MSRLLIHENADRKIYSGRYEVKDGKLILHGLQYSAEQKKMLRAQKTFAVPSSLPSGGNNIVLVTDAKDKPISAASEGRWVFPPSEDGRQVAVYATTAVAVDEYDSCTKVVFPVRNGETTVWHKAVFWGAAAKNALILRPENGQKKRVILKVGKPKMFAGHPEHFGLSFDIL